jgi:hypothetical protein
MHDVDCFQGACVVKTQQCTPTPAFLPGNSSRWDSSCEATEGGLCRAHCREGFVGAPVFTCNSGSWVRAMSSMSCVLDTSTCPIQPPYLPPNTIGWDECAGKEEGAVCVATCAPGFRGKWIDTKEGTYHHQTVAISIVTASKGCTDIEPSIRREFWSGQ